MKIFVLTSVYPPLGHSGHDERCRQAVSGMARSGHKVQVLTSQHRLPPIGKVEEKGVFRELCLFEDSSNKEELGERYDATLVHEKHNLTVLNHRLSKMQPDLIWIWNMRGLSKSLLFWLQEQDLPLVFDLHSNWLLPEQYKGDPWYNWWHHSEKLRSRLRRGWNRLTNSLNGKSSLPRIGQSAEIDLRHSYLCSEALRAELIDGGIRQAADLPIIYPFSDESEIKRKTEYRKNGRCFMWAGRLTALKGPDIALGAVALLRDRGIEVELDCFTLGSPSERKSFRNQIERLDLGELVRSMGARPGDLFEHYPNYDGFLSTSRSVDPFPITVQEAILSKLPCLISETGGIPEVLEGLDTVMHFEPGNTEALADAIERFLELEDGGRQMAEECILSLRRAGSFEILRSHLESISS